MIIAIVIIRVVGIDVVIHRQLLLMMIEYIKLIIEHSVEVIIIEKLVIFLLHCLLLLFLFLRIERHASLFLLLLLRSFPRTHSTHSLSLFHSHSVSIYTVVSLRLRPYPLFFHVSLKTPSHALPTSV